MKYFTTINIIVTFLYKCQKLYKKFRNGHNITLVHIINTCLLMQLTDYMSTTTHY